MAEENKSLEQSVSDAVEQDAGLTEETQTETSEEETQEESEDTEDSTEEEDSEESSDEDDEEDAENVFSTDLSNEDLARAEKIYKSLNGPDAVEYFKFLANQAGYELVDKGTKKEESSSGGEEISELDQVLSEVLGDNYKFLDSKVINAIKAYDKINAKRLADLEAKSEQKDAKSEATNVIKSRLTEFGKKHKLSFEEGKGDDITDAMNTIAKKIPFSGETIEDFDEYLDVIHASAVARVNKTAGKVNRINKIRQNLEDDSPSSVNTDDKGVRRGPAKPTLMESLEAAISSEGVLGD